MIADLTHYGGHLGRRDIVAGGDLRDLAQTEDGGKKFRGDVEGEAAAHGFYPDFAIPLILFFRTTLG